MDVAKKIEFIQSTMEPMAWHTYPYLAGVLAVRDADTGRHVGSALRLSLAGRRCIVTAAHVVHEASSGGRVAVSAVRGQAPYELRGAPDGVDKTLDVAAYLLPPDYPDEGISFWPSERADTTKEKLRTDYLFVHGFPDSRARFSPLLDGIVESSFPYGAMLREDDLPEGVAPFQFAMDFDPASMFGADGAQAEWLDPYGLSGSPVWRIGASGQKVDAWKPDLSMLVGIVTTWRPDEKLLLATMVGPVLDVLSRCAIGSSTLSSVDRGSLSRRRPTMSVPHEAIARRLAIRFAPEIDEHLPALTDRALAGEPGEATQFRGTDPSVLLALASFLVSLSSLAWTIYKDMKQKQTTATDVAFLKGVILERLRQEATAPRALAEPMRERLLVAAADEALDESRRVEKG